jgi:hypothetical protein
LTNQNLEMSKYLEIGEEKPSWEWNNGSRWQKFDLNAEKQIEDTYQKNQNGSVQVRKRKRN